MAKLSTFIFVILCFSQFVVAQTNTRADPTRTPSGEMLHDDLQASQRIAREAKFINANKARPKFASIFEKAQNAILKNDLEHTEPLISKLQEMPHLNDYEQSRIYLIQYWYYGKQGNQELENESASKLLSIGAGKVDPVAFVEAGTRLFKRQYNNQDLGGAIETLANLRKEPSSQSELNSIILAVQKIDDMAVQQENIVQNIHTDASGNWTAKLFKSSFLFNEIKGEINSIGFNCVNKQTVLNYKPDSVMAIPDTWGSCTIKINAKSNTTFSFVQLQNKPTS